MNVGVFVPFAERFGVFPDCSGNDGGGGFGIVGGFATGECGNGEWLSWSKIFIGRCRENNACIAMSSTASSGLNGGSVDLKFATEGAEGVIIRDAFDGSDGGWKRGDEFVWFWNCCHGEGCTVLDVAE